MKVQYADYGAGSTPERDVPYDVVKRFLDWLMTTNMHRLVDNDAWLGTRLRKLRSELVAGAIRLEEEARNRPAGTGTAEMTALGVLAMCDVATIGELQRLVAQGRELEALTAPTP